MISKRIAGKTAALALLALGLTLLAVEPALAAEAEKTAFQKWWALGWRIVNFLILAVLLFKVAKDPAKKFFSDKRKEAEAARRTKAWLESLKF